MTDVSAADRASSRRSGDRDVFRHHVRHEALTMALYVSICLLAELAALADSALEHGAVFVVVWGTTIGLALAHLFAFLLAGRLIEGKRIGALTRATAVAQLAGAASVAVVVSAVIVLVPISIEVDAARYDLAAVIGIIGYVIARRAEVSRVRAVLFALAMTISGLMVAAIKQRLGGH